MGVFNVGYVMKGALLIFFLCNSSDGNINLVLNTLLGFDKTFKDVFAVNTAKEL